MVNQNADVHPTAIICEGARLGPGTKIGAYSIIGAHVVLGDDNDVGPHCVIDGHTRIGNGNRFSPFCSIGGPPQDLKYRGEPSELVIGDRNIIREGATLQPGTTGGGMLTSVGNENLFMAYSHLGHDSHIGSRCVLANSVAVAGHVTIEDGVILGGLTGIHQFVRIGRLSMTGAGTMVAQDIPPFCTAQGDRAKLIGINKVGLERAGIDKSEISLLRRTYRDIFVSDDRQILSKRIETALAQVPEGSVSKAFLDFIKSASRGVPRHRGTESMDGE